MSEKLENKEIFRKPLAEKTAGKSTGSKKLSNIQYQIQEICNCPKPKAAKDQNRVHSMVLFNLGLCSILLSLPGESICLRLQRRHHP